MKLSKLFHWLYATLMFLPLFIIPMFAIYTRNESNTFENNIELQVEQNKVVDFNQLLNNGNFNSLSGWNKSNNTNAEIVNDTVYLTPIDNTIGGYRFLSDGLISYYTNHKYFIKCWNDYNSDNYYAYYRILNISTYSTVFSLTLTNKTGFNSGIYTAQYDFSGYVSLVYDNVDYCYFDDVMVVDLTQMFGEGNEPTVEQFNQLYPNDYYSYTLSEKQLLKNYSVKTLNNTDIGSQLLYSVYKPVNDYFNIKDWMNLGGLYDWFLLNIFNGSNSIVIPIIFNLIIYWLVVSFIWLIFDVLMYVPNMIHKMLDKARLE